MTVVAHFFKNRAWWRLSLVLIALPVALTLLTIIGSLFYFDPSVFNHLASHVLPEAIFNTITLVVGVCLLSAILGVATAWLTTVCDFPLRSFFSWSLFLPMAIPGYVMAFAAVGFFEYTGLIQSTMREAGIPVGWFPDIYSYGGVTFVMALVFYPYIYLLAKSAFQTQGMRSIEVGRSLGFSIYRSFFKVALPMARPWIVGGMLLVMMETLADFGTVSVFNYNTLTAAIYKSWFSFYSIVSALQIAAVLLLIVFLVTSLERWGRRSQRYTDSGERQVRERFELQGAKKWLAVLFCSLILLFALLLPLFQLLYWLLPNIKQELSSGFFVYIKGSVFLASLAMLLVVFVATILAFLSRMHDDRFVRLSVRLSTIGYALPGTVLAVGLFVPISWMDHQLAAMGVGTQLLQGTLIVMLLAYSVRFMAVAYSPIENNFLRITPSVDMAGRSLGVSGLALLRRIHIPMLRSGLFTALVLVFVDVMKELPITLMTRPFGVSTLAVRIYEFTSEGLWERAALPALMIVLVGVLPVILLIRRADNA